MSRARRLRGDGRTKEQRHQQRRALRAERQRQQRAKALIAPVARESRNGYAVSDGLWCTEEGYHVTWALYFARTVTPWHALKPDAVDMLLNATWRPDKPKSVIDKLASLVPDD